MNLRKYIKTSLDFLLLPSKGGDMKCEGCKDHGSCTTQCKGSVAINECPCQECLIKGVCNKPCEALAKHYEKTNMAYIHKMGRKIQNES
jgi:hypothetical protein